MAASTFHAITTGLSAFSIRDYELDFLQGKSHCYAAIVQVSQACLLQGVLEKVISTVSFAAMPWITGAVLGSAVLVQTGLYQHITGRFKLPVSWIKMADFCLEHAGSLIQVALFISSIAAVVLGHFSYGLPLLAILTYQAAYRRGPVSKSEGNFVNERLIPLGSYCSLLTAPFILKIGQAIALAPTNALVLLDQALRFAMPFLCEPSLKQIREQASSVTYTEEEAIKILNANFEDFEINPAHFTKMPLSNEREEEVCQNISKLQEAFDKIDWQQDKEAFYHFRSRLLEDDIFVDFLKKNCPEMLLSAPVVTQQDVTSRLETLNDRFDGIEDELYLTLLQKDALRFQGKESLKKEIANIVRSREEDPESYSKGLSHLKARYPWSVLSGHSNRDLQTALKMKVRHNRWLAVEKLVSRRGESVHALSFFTSFLRPNHLEELAGDSASSLMVHFGRANLSHLARELSQGRLSKEHEKQLISILSNLDSLPRDVQTDLVSMCAVIGGYCPEGIANYIKDLEMQLTSIKALAPAECLYAQLAQVRQGLVRETYQEVSRTLNLPSQFECDVHTLELYSFCIAYGFVPMTQAKLREFGFIDYLTWLSYGFARKPMYESYKEKLLASVEMQDVYHFLHDECPFYRTLPRKEPKKFAQLALSMLGVIRPKADSSLVSSAH